MFVHLFMSITNSGISGLKNMDLLILIETAELFYKMIYIWISQGEDFLSTGPMLFRSVSHLIAWI